MSVVAEAAGVAPGALPLFAEVAGVAPGVLTLCAAAGSDDRSAPATTPTSRQGISPRARRPTDFAETIHVVVMKPPEMSAQRS